MSTVIESQLPAARRVAGLLNVTTRTVRPGTVTLTVRGEVDMFTAASLGARLQEQIRPAGPDLVVDLSEITFFGAAGLTVLLSAQAEATAAEIGFSLVANTRPVLFLLAIAGLDSRRADNPQPRISAAP